MVPAMDRALHSRPHSRRSRIGLALALAIALCSADLGCSRLKSSRRDAGPPMLGRKMEGNDVYAEARRPATAEGGPSTALAATTLAATGDDEPSLPPVAAPTRVGAGPRLASSSAGRDIPPSDRGPDPQADALRLVAEARSSLDAMQAYQVAMHRQERVNGALLPDEDVILAVRRQPVAVRLTWPSGPHKGREVLYRADEPGGLMHVNPGSPLPRMNLAPDSPLVMRSSRHPITEAGFDSLVRSLEADLQLPDLGGLAATGGTTLTRVKPDGESWKVTMDPRTHLPSVVECTDRGGELLERYEFRGVQADPSDLAAPAAFDPEARWGPPRGLFGLGRADKPGAPTTR